MAESGLSLEELISKLNDFEPRYRSVAFEGASMGVALSNWKSWAEYANRAKKHNTQVHIGLGWAVAEKQLNLPSTLSQIEPEMHVKVLDGIGYWNGLFQRRTTIRTQQIPENITLEYQAGFDQGLGRAIWYITRGEVDKVANIINHFSEERKPNLWQGIGVALTFVGGCSDELITELKFAAGEFRLNFEKGIEAAEASMTKTAVPIYWSLEEKSNFFNFVKPIETNEEFDAFWNRLEVADASTEFIYRGVKKAEYKLYNSLQRMWLEHRPQQYGLNYDQFIANSIEISSIVPSKLRGIIKTENGDLGNLGAMQHYYEEDRGQTAPTPLLDFSFNPFIALYFALEPSSSKTVGELASYCSIYSVNLNNWLLQGYQNLFHQFVKNAKDQSVKYSEIHIAPLAHLHTHDDFFKLKNNKRIINQEGTFFLVTDERFAVEERLKLDIEFAIADKRLPRKTNPLVIDCLHVHKDLSQYALHRLKTEKGVDKNFIYPDLA